VEKLDLSVRSMNCLRRGGINTVGNLLSMDEKEIASLRNFGQKSRQEVEEKLQSLGVPFTYGAPAEEPVEEKPTRKKKKAE